MVLLPVLLGAQHHEHTGRCRARHGLQHAADGGIDTVAVRIPLYMDTVRPAAVHLDRRAVCALPCILDRVYSLDAFIHLARQLAQAAGRQIKFIDTAK